ncbi:MAG: hypothetical protein GXY23_02010 [Myxococcales bacterium]|jgi:hypothetical protein|nr:hypothetical protein [Myxococcales bacterium]
MSKIDRERALLNPSEVFGSPDELLAYEGLSRSEKIEILRRWAYEAAELSVAEDEGMGELSVDDDVQARGGGEAARLMDAIRRGLRELGADAEETAGLTKHGSIPVPTK